MAKHLEQNIEYILENATTHPVVAEWLANKNGEMCEYGCRDENNKPYSVLELPENTWQEKVLKAELISLTWTAFVISLYTDEDINSENTVAVVTGNLCGAGLHATDCTPYFVAELPIAYFLHAQEYGYENDDFVPELFFRCADGYLSPDIYEIDRYWTMLKDGFEISKYVDVDALSIENYGCKWAEADIADICAEYSDPMTEDEVAELRKLPNQLLLAVIIENGGQLALSFDYVVLTTLYKMAELYKRIS